LLNCHRTEFGLKDIYSHAWILKQDDKDLFIPNQVSEESISQRDSSSLGKLENISKLDSSIELSKKTSKKMNNNASYRAYRANSSKLITSVNYSKPMHLFNNPIPVLLQIKDDNNEDKETFRFRRDDNDFHTKNLLVKLTNGENLFESVLEKVNEHERQERLKRKSIINETERDKNQLDSSRLLTSELNIEENNENPLKFKKYSLDGCVALDDNKIKFSTKPDIQNKGAYSSINICSQNQEDIPTIAISSRKNISSSIINEVKKKTKILRKSFDIEYLENDKEKQIDRDNYDSIPTISSGTQSIPTMNSSDFKVNSSKSPSNKEVIDLRLTNKTHKSLIPIDELSFDTKDSNTLKVRELIKNTSKDPRENYLAMRKMEKEKQREELRRLFKETENSIMMNKNNNNTNKPMAKNNKNILNTPDMDLIGYKTEVEERPSLRQESPKNNFKQTLSFLNKAKENRYKTEFKEGESWGKAKNFFSLNCFCNSKD